MSKLPVACFAPALTEDKLASYELLVEAMPAELREIKDAMLGLLKCVKAWWELPDSKRTDGERFKIIHKGQESEMAITPLEAEHVEQLWDVTPWPREIPGLQQLFDQLPTGTVEENGACKIVDQAAHELRNAAFHLLWHVNEIALDREPMTDDKLPAAAPSA